MLLNPFSWVITHTSSILTDCTHFTFWQLKLGKRSKSGKNKPKHKLSSAPKRINGSRDRFIIRTQGSWTRWPINAPSNWNNSMVLWFSYLLCSISTLFSFHYTNKSLRVNVPSLSVDRKRTSVSSLVHSGFILSYSLFGATIFPPAIFRSPWLFNQPVLRLYANGGKSLSLVQSSEENEKCLNS